MSRRIIDLTFPIHDGMPTYPSHWHPFVEVNQLGRIGIENRETRKITLGTHTGTHCDAPLHFIKDGYSIDQLELDTLVGKARLIDVSYIEENQPVTIEAFAKQLSGKEYKRVVFRFDWDKNWGNAKYYKSHPYFSNDAIQWLIDYGIKLIALDTPSPDNPNNNADSRIDSPNHKLLLHHNIIIVEYLTNLDQLRLAEVDLIVMPIKILGGDGAPVRCIAIENDTNKGV